MYDESVTKRFNKKVDKNGDCWVWLGYKEREKSRGNNHGKIRIGGKSLCVHRVAWIIANGEIENGLHVLHKCNNPPCVNPKHLYLGTHKENMRDMVLDGRSAWKNIPREKHPRAKVSEAQLKQIIELSDSMGNVALSKMFNIDRGTVWRLLKKYKTKGDIK